MIAVMLVMIVGGISLSQAVSDPRQVTLRWLRLGGVVALSLLGVAATIQVRVGAEVDRPIVYSLGVVAVPVLVQLMAVQMAWRRAGRVAAGVGFLASVTLAWIVLRGVTLTAVQAYPYMPEGWSQARLTASLIGTTPVSAGLLGGFLITMLLGHAYLTAGHEMTQAPLRRLVVMLGGLWGLRSVLAVSLGVWPYMTHAGGGLSGGLAMRWDVVMIAARCAVGLVVPGVFIYMIHDCVRRRANQSATGILYVAMVLVMIGEGLSLALLGVTGWVF